MPSNASSPTGGETSQTLDRGLQLIELLTRTENIHGLTITELAKALGIGRAMVYRLVATLCERDYLRHEPGQRVRLGLGIARLNQALMPLLADWATPILRELAESVSATAHLTIADGGQARAVAVVEPTTTMFHVAYRAGAQHPLEHGAAGRAILAGRTGSSELIFSRGELQTSAYGAAVAVLSRGATSPIDASVGVVSMDELPASVVEGPIRQAAAALAAVIDNQ